MVEREIKSKISKLLSNLKKKGVEPTQVVLFGSRARGDYLTSSDIDLLLVSDGFKGIAFIERLQLVERCWPSNKLALEAIPLTPSEFSKKSKQLGIVSRALKEGIVLSG